MKVDYDKLAGDYDKHRGGGGPYLASLVDLATQANAHNVLELGAGTGNNTAAFQDAYPCELTALELSSGMLSRALDKRLPARWVRADAQRIPLRDACMEYIFGCYFLHHVSDLEALFAECARVLNQGCAAFVTAPVDFIERHPMNAYFPSFAKVDKARFKPYESIRQAMQAGGLTRLDAIRVSAPRRPVDRAYVERIANKFISTYRLLPEAEFNEGLQRLRHDIEPRGYLDCDIVWEALVVYGWREH